MDKTRATIPVLAFLLLVLMPWPAEAQVGFGASAAVGDHEVFVGEPGNVIEPGRVYVYRAGSSGWTDAQRLSGAGGANSDGFGKSIAVDGDLLAIGADAAGVVYIFERSGGAWRQSARLGSGDAGFGTAVAVDGDTVVVGAPAGGGGDGAVHVYRRSTSGWELSVTLGPESEDAEPGDHASFGTTVAMQGDWILVGAPGGTLDMFLQAAFSQGPPAGAVHAYRKNDDGWSAAGDLAPAIGAEGAMLGSSLAVRDGVAMVGAVTSERFSGAVHVFRVDEQAGDWSWRGRLMPFDARPGAMFGAALAMGDQELLVGAPGAGTGRLEGRVYRFTRGDSGEWVGAAKVNTTGLQWGSAYGAALARGGDIVVAGLPGDDYGAGTAVIMTRMDDGWDRSRVASDARGLDPITGGGLPCENGRAGMFECDNVDLVAFLPVHEMGGGRGVTTNDLWGWTDPETGRDYAVVGMRDGTAFVDVTEPAEPVFVGKLPKTEESPASLWRDVKVHANHAFIVADASGPHGVQIFDLTRLREFDGRPMMFSEDAHYSRVYSSHNININEDSAFAYAVGNSSGGETCGGALHMINVEDPQNPMFAGCFEPLVVAGRGAGGTHDVQCVTYHGPDERYDGSELCFSSDGRALNIGDVTDKRNPRLLASADYPNLAYTHQGWLDENHEYFYMNDEGDEVAGLVSGTRTLIWDVADLEDPILVGEYTTDSTATDHNLYIVGDVMYQSNYRSGLRVVDISDRENPSALGFFDTVPWGDDDGMGDILSGAIGSWSNYPFFGGGIVAVTSGKEGLFILRVRDGADRP